jgi:mannose-6-phosphate isomerase-like protein (cupin superfamily)
MSGFLVGPGEGESVWSLGGRFTVKLPGDQCDQRFSVTESVAFQTTEPPMHVHQREDEAWFVLEGHLTFCVGEQVLEAGPGSFAYAPKGLPHTFTVDIEPSRVLVFASPAGFEQFALDLGHPATGDDPPPGMAMPGPDVLGPVAERYGIDVVGPPVRAGS